MPNIKITDNLRDIIKSKRKETGITGGELSDILGKGKAYISQLEKGRINTIETETLVTLFRNIEKNMSDKDFDTYINNLIDNQTKNDIDHEKWLIFFNYQIRQFPIEDSLISFIGEELRNLIISAKELVIKVNENIGLSNDDNITKENVIHINIKPNDNGYFVTTSIKFNIPIDTIEQILSRDIKTSNYIQMQGIIWNIFHAKGFTNEEAHKETRRVLYDNNFMTVDERKDYIRKKAEEKEKNNEEFTYYDLLPTQKEKDFKNLLDKIVTRLNFQRDKNIIYMCEQLTQLDKNMKMDLDFMIALIGLKYEKLRNVDIEKRKEFLNKIIKLIEEYSNSTDTTENSNIELNANNDSEK